ncbi:MAG: hypothetical protein QM756_26750 [Polyangiaceae bacterium]
MSVGALRVALAGIGLTFCVTTPAQAQPASEGLVVTGFGSCPQPEAVRAAILQLTSSRSRSALPPDSRVSVNDQGASFRVSVTTEGGNAERTYSDPARTCERRARFAAVFAIVTLMPPDLGPEEALAEPKSEPPPEPPRVAPPAPPPALLPPAPPEPPQPAPPWLRLEFAAVAEQALNGSLERVVRGFGAELSASLGRARVVPALSLAYAPNRELLFAEGTCVLTRAQAVPGVRFVAHPAAFTFAGEAGLVLALSRVRGSNFEHPATGSALDLGARARFVASYDAFALKPLLALETALFPSPTEVRALPQGSLGRLPTLWLGASLGVALGF